MQNKVTIVIPTFNRACYVGKTIESALNQTVPCDIVVCDHGSSDNTPDVIKKYEDKIKYIRRERNFGPHFGWLEGVLHAETEFVHIHFDDDLMDPAFIEKTLNLMSDEVGMVFSDAVLFNVQNHDILNPNIFKFKDRFKTGLYDVSVLEYLLLDKRLMFSPAMCLYRKKEVIDAILTGDLPVDFGGKYHGVGSDLLMNFLPILRYKKFGIVTDSLTWFGWHDGSITIDASKDPEKQKKLENAYNAYRKYYKLIKLYVKDKNIQREVGYLSVRKMPLYKKIERNFKLFLKAIGLRKKEVK